MPIFGLKKTASGKDVTPAARARPPLVRDGKYAGHPLVLRIIRIILYCRIIRKRIMCVGRPPSGTKCILCYPKISQDIVAYISGYCGICWYVGKIKCYQVWPSKWGARYYVSQLRVLPVLCIIRIILY